MQGQASKDRAVRSSKHRSGMWERLPAEAMPGPAREVGKQMQAPSPTLAPPLHQCTRVHSTSNIAAQNAVQAEVRACTTVLVKWRNGVVRCLLETRPP
jgi:hypothetical protein